MASPQEKLADALGTLMELQNTERRAFRSEEITRIHREILLKNGYIKEATKGWYIISSPDERTGDTTSWYNTYWDFCARYYQEKYRQDWVLSPEQSVLIHAGNWTIPQQLIVRATNGSNHVTQLPFNTSIFTIKANIPAAELITEEKGIRMYSLAASLIYCSPNTYTHNPIDVRSVLGTIKDASEILGILLAEGHTTYAGRLAGAFRNIGRNAIADDIVDTMRTAGFEVREEDPFEQRLNFSLPQREISPYVHRMRLMWHSMREVIIPLFPKAPGMATDKDNVMKDIEAVYVIDAYHSLSIEKYKVTPELIRRVREGQWSAAEHEQDRKQRDAMAARGYWLAFQQVKNSVSALLEGGNAGAIASEDHRRWYRELFGPSVQAGLLKATDLAGYRGHQVYITNSLHTPLNVDAVRDVMPVLFELLEKEPEASVRTVLGHFVFVYIHPYMDGNGRMARFLLNLMLISGGYPWTVIPVEQRDAYMQALEQASVRQNIEPFARFIAALVEAGMKGEPVATIKE